MAESAPVALLYALEAEGEPFLEALEGRRQGEAAGRAFFLGSIGPNEVVIAKTGVGKVACAHAVSVAITKYGARAVVMAGAAGAVGGGVRVGDLILGRHLIQHDLGTREGRRAETTGELRASLATALAAGPRRVLEGTILTGDKACVTLRRRIFLRWWFRRDRPLAVDMESASAGVVAAAAGLPHAVLRIATDSAGPFALAEFQANYRRLAPEPARCIVEWLRRGPQANR